MEAQVIYYSRKGATRKVAEVIASEFCVKATNVKDVTLNDNAFLILGSGCYGGKPGKDMINFINEHDFSGKNIALFGTSGGGIGKETEAMEKMIQENGGNVTDKFFCRGKFFLMNKGKPSEKDLKQAKEFASNLK